MTVTGFFRRILAVPLQRPRDEETENAPLTGSEKQYEPDEVHCQCCRQAGIPRVGSKAIGSRTVRNVALCCVLVLNILLFGCSYYLLNRRPAPCNDRASLWCESTLSQNQVALLIDQRPHSRALATSKSFPRTTPLAQRTSGWESLAMHSIRHGKIYGWVSATTWGSGGQQTL